MTERAKTPKQVKNRTFRSTVILIVAIGAIGAVKFYLTRRAESLKRCRAISEQTPRVNSRHFIKTAIIGEIKIEKCQLVDGRIVDCYVFTTKSEPTEHKMGPWVPKNVNSGADEGGLWVHDGKIHNVDGAFVKALPQLYKDPEWDLVRADGSIKVTDTKTAFEAAARPDVHPDYHNHGVEGHSHYYPNRTTTYRIPIRPIYTESYTWPGHGGVGVAFNGVNFDPPAPIHAIIGAHTIALFDKAGGHVNPHVGYHYHLALGKTKEVAQSDGHAPLIGYALDGFGIYAHFDKDGKAPGALDECSGHFDKARGYHYHASAPGRNQIISRFRGVPGTMTVRDK